MEPHGTVVVEENGTIVKKSYRGDDPSSLHEVAETEFQRQRVFWESLRSADTVSCPRPLELIEGSSPQIRMEFAPGTPVSQHLRDVDVGPTELEWLARNLILALDCYVQSVNEPYYDFHLRNMLYDRTNRVVAFVDFGIPKRMEPSLPNLSQLSALEVSLGNLVAGTIFESARPRSFYRIRQHRQALRLCSAVLEGFLRREADRVTLRNVQLAAATAYKAAAHWGPAPRRSWYRFLGPLLARRLVVHGVVFAPA